MNHFIKLTKDISGNTNGTPYFYDLYVSIVPSPVEGGLNLQLLKVKDWEINRAGSADGTLLCHQTIRSMQEPTSEDIAARVANLTNYFQDTINGYYRMKPLIMAEVTPRIERVEQIERQRHRELLGRVDDLTKEFETLTGIVEELREEVESIIEKQNQKKGVRNHEGKRRN